MPFVSDGESTKTPLIHLGKADSKNNIFPSGDALFDLGGKMAILEPAPQIRTQ